MEFGAGLAFWEDHLSEIALTFIFFLQLWFIFGQKLTVTILRGIILFCCEPITCTVLFWKALRHICLTLCENLFLSNLWEVKDFLSWTGREQKRNEKGIEESIWEGNIEIEQNRRSSCKKALEEFKAKNKSSTAAYTGMAEPMAQSSGSDRNGKGKSNNNGSARGRKKKR